jgi:uncharacterized protein YjcR
MTIKKQAVQEHLTQGFTYRQLAEKYGLFRSTVNTWVRVHQVIHNLPRSNTDDRHKGDRFPAYFVSYSVKWLIRLVCFCG